MFKKLILCHKINKFYKLFHEVVEYEPDRVRIHDLSNHDCLSSVGFDIAEVLECSDPSCPISRWLNKLSKEVMYNV